MDIDTINKLVGCAAYIEIFCFPIRFLLTFALKYDRIKV